MLSYRNENSSGFYLAASSTSICKAKGPIAAFSSGLPFGGSQWWIASVAEQPAAAVCEMKQFKRIDDKLQNKQI